MLSQHNATSEIHVTDFHLFLWAKLLYKQSIGESGELGPLSGLKGDTPEKKNNMEFIYNL